MVQEKFSALLPTIEKTASAEFGIPSLKARSKMKKRLLKKKRLFPYAGLCGDVRMRLRRESTTADYPRAKLDPDLSEHDAVMLDLLIDTAEESARTHIRDGRTGNDRRAARELCFLHGRPSPPSLR